MQSALAYVMGFDEQEDGFVAISTGLIDMSDSTCNIVFIKMRLTMLAFQMLKVSLVIVNGILARRVDARIDIVRDS